MITIAQVFENSPNPTYVLSRHRQIVWANEAYAQLNRCSLQDVLENKFIDINLAIERDIEILAYGKEFEVEEFYKLEDGRSAWYKTYKNPVLQQNGEVVLVSTSFDISSFKEIIKKAEDSNATKTKVLEDLSSELEAPINAIVGLAKLLKKTEINKEQKNFIKSILSISDYLKDVPNDILELTLVNDGVLEKELEVVDVAEFINKTLLSLSSKENEFGIKIHFNQPLMRLPLLKINPHYLDVIISKVISSSIRYTKSNGILFSYFQKERQGDKLFIQFSIGNIKSDIFSDDLEEIFNPEGSDNYRNKNKLSNDIGINTCKKIVQLLGGKIWFENRKAFGGSIEILIPFYTGILQPVKPSFATNDATPTRVVSYLLVGEMETNQLLVQYQNINWEIQLDIAKNGRQAVKLASEKQYDVIVMSVELPDIDGFQTASLIRRHDGLSKDVPIIAIVDNEQDLRLNSFKELGFTDYLVKPFHANDLCVSLSNYIGHFLNKQASVLSEKKEDSAKLYDFSGLGSLGEDAVFIRKMQDLFVEIVPDQLQKLANTIELQQWQEVAMIAHSLKSTYGNIRIVEAAEFLRRIEDNASSKTNLHELNYYLKRIEQVTDKVLKEFVN